MAGIQFNYAQYQSGDAALTSANTSCFEAKQSANYLLSNKPDDFPGDVSGLVDAINNAHTTIVASIKKVMEVREHIMSIGSKYSSVNLGREKTAKEFGLISQDLDVMGRSFLSDQYVTGKVKSAENEYNNRINFYEGRKAAIDKMVSENKMTSLEGEQLKQQYSDTIEQIQQENDALTYSYYQIQYGDNPENNDKLDDATREKLKEISDRNVIRKEYNKIYEGRVSNLEGAFGLFAAPVLGATKAVGNYVGNMLDGIAFGNGTELANVVSIFNEDLGQKIMDKTVDIVDYDVVDSIYDGIFGNKYGKMIDSYEFLGNIVIDAAEKVAMGIDNPPVKIGAGIVTFLSTYGESVNKVIDYKKDKGEHITVKDGDVTCLVAGLNGTIETGVNAILYGGKKVPLWVKNIVGTVKEGAKEGVTTIYDGKFDGGKFLEGAITSTITNTFASKVLDKIWDAGPGQLIKSYDVQNLGSPSTDSGAEAFNQAINSSSLKHSIGDTLKNKAGDVVKVGSKVVKNISKGIAKKFEKNVLKKYWYNAGE